MVVHLVLFRPRADLSEPARHALVDALHAALREIPTIRRARVGRRIMLGRAYESRMRADYSHVAVLEFDDVSGLQAYMVHPSHQRLAERFFDAFEEALMYDYELGDAGETNSVWQDRGDRTVPQP